MLAAPVLFLSAWCSPTGGAAARDPLPPGLQQQPVQRPGSGQAPSTRLRSSRWLAIGLAFQLPIGLLGLHRLGVINGSTLTRHWRYATVIIAVIAAAMPGADPVTTGLETLPLVILFLASIVMLKFADRRDAARRCRSSPRLTTTRPRLYLPMLFDLRSRGRRRTVQVVYLGLALLMGGGLVLFGVGAGNGLGGLLNAFTGNGSGNAQSQVLSQQEKSALEQTKPNPNNAAALGATWSAPAGQRRPAATNDYNSSTGTFTAAGKKELAATTAAWEHYLQLTKTPDPNLAILAARAYADLGQYSGAANAWEIQAPANPSSPRATSAWPPPPTRPSRPARATWPWPRPSAWSPRLSRTTLKTQIQAAKTTPRSPSPAELLARPPPRSKRARVTSPPKGR